ncbi:MAG: TonB-dependent receptor plug domain-containing protein [Chitinophagaceae bacterium]|nr:TonB-dependent receptor plug domain-containing protein [Chitinophagaceae bacterium]
MKKIVLFLLVITVGLTMQAQGKIDPTNGTIRTVLDMLRVIPGVEVAMAQGGSTQTQVYIRGNASLRLKTVALIVVDKAIFAGDVTQINPQDVADITVLKDAASASAYGAQGSGGVIVITTKSGSSPSNNPAVNTYKKSVYNYFIEKKIELNIYGVDDKLITSGVIKEEQDSSIVVRKKTILKASIGRVEIKPE